MPRQQERQTLLMALAVLGASGLAVRSVAPPSIVQQAAGRVVTPVQHALTSASASANGMLGAIREIESLRRRNTELEDRVNSLEVENTKLEDLKRENRQLRDELTFPRERVDLSLTGASVVGHRVAGEPGSLIHTIKTDIGERDGVRRGMPVANSRGLVGQVTATGPYWCNVRLITDPASAVWGRIQRSRATGVVYGSTTGELTMRFLPQNVPGEEPYVAEGDLVYTSGLSERFPPLILIGQVMAVHQSDERTHQEAIVRPSVDFNALEVVLVINGWLPASEQVTEGAVPPPDR